MALVRVMPPPALRLPLLLCVLLLPLEAQGGYRGRKWAPASPWTPEAAACKQWPSAERCSLRCSYFQNCQVNSTCCLTFCGSVCLSIL
ncbi:protein WFDC10B [Marmota monax]|uniref:protein WFDC10B n=1 Tax=Marmota monax TaxID=9995 RepID=UPI0026EA0FDF|nr:protein WFDC10B [Marmota monax]